MAVKLLGADPMDETIVTQLAIGGGDAPLDTDPTVSGYVLARSAAGNALDLDAGDNVEGSRGGMRMSINNIDHTYNAEVFGVRTETNVSYHMRVYEDAIYIFGTNFGTGISSNRGGNAPSAAGACRMKYQMVSASTFKIVIETWNGSSWGGGVSFGATLSDNPSPHRFWTLQVAIKGNLTDDGTNATYTPTTITDTDADFTGYEGYTVFSGAKRLLITSVSGTTATGSAQWNTTPTDGDSWAVNNQVRLLLNGTTYIDWQTLGIAASGNLGTPSLGGFVSGSFRDTLFNYVSEVIVTENDTLEIDLPADSGVVEYRATVVYPSSDDSLGNWVVAGDAQCDSTRWRAIDDPEDNDDKADDSIKTPNNTQTDCFFGHQDEVNGATATIVGVCQMNVHGRRNPPSDFLFNDGTTTLVTARKFAGLLGFLTFTNLPLAPDGGAWTVGDINGSTFGIRASVNDARSYALGLIVVGKHVFGTDTHRGTKAETCPAAATFTPRVMVY